MNNENLTAESYFARTPCIQQDFNEMLVIGLSITCGVLIIMLSICGVHLCKLRKRPKWKKKYVVNKGKRKVDLTSRPKPDHCEIAIEDCCNMNICETVSRYMGVFIIWALSHVSYVRANAGGMYRCEQKFWHTFLENIFQICRGVPPVRKIYERKLLGLIITVE